MPWAILLIFLISACGNGVSSLDPSADCPQYIVEGQQLYCECRALNVNVQNTLPKASWPGHSDSYQLLVQNVRREDNGTRFTCQVTDGTQTKTTVYVMQVAYGPTDESTNIVGPETFVTDGTRNLTLTCTATEVNPVPAFSWSGVICDEGNQVSTCTFRPKTPGDDGKRVSCRATNQIASIPNEVGSGVTIFSVNLTYPPSSAPVVTGYTPGDVLKTGDRVTCTVTGGKPLVSAVIFKCSNPELPDQSDVSNGVTSVSSDVIVDTSKSVDGAPICTCQGVWEPEVELYTQTALANIQTEYKASVLDFAINGTSSEFVVNENEAAAIFLECRTNGRPKPNVTLTRTVDATVLRQVDGVDELRFVMTSVKCEQMGLYACSADNGYPSPSSMSARLTVHCAPRQAASDSSSPNSQTLPKLTTNGLNLTLISHPIPTSFVYSFHSNHSSNPGSRLSRRLFTTSCQKTDEEEYMALCAIEAAVEMGEEDFGVYAVTIGNTMGTMEFFFAVDNAVTARAGLSTDGGSGGDMPIAAIAGGAAAGVAVVIIVVVVVVIARGRANKGASGDEAQKADDDDEVIEEHDNVAYVSADELDQNSNQSSPRKKSPDAEPLSSARSTSGYDYVAGYAPKDKDGANETDFGYASVSGGNVETCLSVGNDTSTKRESNTYATLNEEPPKPSPREKSPRGAEYAVVEINKETGKSGETKDSKQNVLGSNLDASGPQGQMHSSSDRGHHVHWGNEYADVEDKASADDTKNLNAEAKDGNPEKTIGPLGDVYSTIDRASKKNKKNPEQKNSENTDQTTGPLGDVYAQVHKTPDSAHTQPNNPARNGSIQKPKRQTKPKPGSVSQSDGGISQSGAATETVQDQNSGASYEDITPGSTAKQSRGEEYEEIALASSSPANTPKVSGNDQGQDDYI